MKYFFHAEVEKYTRRLKHMMLLAAMSVFAVCAFCTINIVLNFGSEIVYLLLALIGGFVFLGMVFGFSAVYITEKYKRRHSNLRVTVKKRYCEDYITYRSRG